MQIKRGSASPWSVVAVTLGPPAHVNGPAHYTHRLLKTLTRATSLRRSSLRLFSAPSDQRSSQRAARDVIVHLARARLWILQLNVPASVVTATCFISAPLLCCRRGPVMTAAWRTTILVRRLFAFAARTDLVGRRRRNYTGLSHCRLYVRCATPRCHDATTQYLYAVTTPAMPDSRLVRGELELESTHVYSTLNEE